MLADWLADGRSDAAWRPEKVAWRCVGLPRDAVVLLVKEGGCTSGVYETVDGRPVAVTMEYQPGRVRLIVSNGVVSNARAG